MRDILITILIIIFLVVIITLKKNLQKNLKLKNYPITVDLLQIYKNIKKRKNIFWFLQEDLH